MKYMGANSIAKIMEELGPTLKLLHTEVALRRCFLDRFHKQQHILRERHAQLLRDRRRRDTVADDISQIEVVYHGTLRRCIQSIVRSGFVLPGGKTGDGQVVGLRCGDTWGRGDLNSTLSRLNIAQLFSTGVYASSDPYYSLGYRSSCSCIAINTADVARGCCSFTDNSAHGKLQTPGCHTLVVCAALLGRRQYCNGDGKDVLNQTTVFDSSISPCELEINIFDPARVLPLFIMWIESTEVSK
jgi:hypothetical protein